MHRAGMFGGAGLNTLTDEYLLNHGLPISMRDQYLNSIERLLTQNVELHIGNHLDDNNSRKKLLQLNREENPFVSDNTYYDFLKYKRKKAIGLFSR